MSLWVARAHEMQEQSLSSRWASLGWGAQRGSHQLAGRELGPRQPGQRAVQCQGSRDSAEVRAGPCGTPECFRGLFLLAGAGMPGEGQVDGAVIPSSPAAFGLDSQLLKTSGRAEPSQASAAPSPGCQIFVSVHLALRQQGTGRSSAPRQDSPGVLTEKLPSQPWAAEPLVPEGAVRAQKTTLLARGSFALQPLPGL